MASVNNSSSEETLSIWLPNAKKMHDAGRSLASTLYAKPVTIMLNGPLGAGKTTFLQGFAEGLGITEAVTSPTFALEQHYRASTGQELLHLDLYRLSPEDAVQLIRSSESHTGIRCVEWAERASMHPVDEPLIRIDLEEKYNGRQLQIAFEDATICASADVVAWQKEAALQPHIAAHCHAVAKTACDLAKYILGDGQILRPLLLRRSAELHDVLRFLDFRPGAAPADVVSTEHDQCVWKQWKKKYPAMRHEEACSAMLREQGYHAMAEIVRTHGWHLAPSERKTTEQKLLFYADKRVAFNQCVSLKERFADFTKRYADTTDSEMLARWHEETVTVERELFPNGVPF